MAKRKSKLDDVPDWVFFPLPAIVLGGLVTLYLIDIKALTWDSLQKLLSVVGNSPVVWIAGGLWSLNYFLQTRNENFDYDEMKIVEPKDKVKQLKRQLNEARKSSSAQNKMLVHCLKRIREYEDM